MSAKLLTMPATIQPTITLRQRVADALSKPTTSSEVRGLLADVQGEVARVERASAAAKAKAVDPMSSDEEANEGKAALSSLTFDGERLATSVALLNARLRDVEAREDQARRQASYDAVKAERDDLAARLKDRYPALAREIAELLQEVKVSNAKIRATNQDLPDDADRTQSVEPVARGVMNFGDRGGMHPISLVRGTTLPSFDITEAYREQMVWFGRQHED